MATPSERQCAAAVGTTCLKPAAWSRYSSAFYYGLVFKLLGPQFPYVENEANTKTTSKGCHRDETRAACRASVPESER